MKTNIVAVNTSGASCHNKDCPNGGVISIAIYKGSGACSGGCLKALGRAPVGQHERKK